MKVAVVGTGYVGLVAGTCFADSGNDVVCVDIDKAKIARLSKGEIPIYEPGLAELVSKNIAQGRLTFSTELAAAVRASEAIFIAVGTPSSHDGAADLTAVLAVAEQIGAALDRWKLVVLKSTVPVGTNALVRAAIAKHAKAEFDVASNPEFMKEGAALEDFLKPDRVIIGATSPRAKELLHELYEPFVRNGNPILAMDPASAEMTKYAANAMLSTKISFMNEIARLCEATGADVEAVRKGIGTDARIGFSFIYPGLGYGGSCFPKDVRALSSLGGKHGVPMPIADAVDRVNRDSRERFAKRVVERLGQGARGAGAPPAESATGGGTPTERGPAKGKRAALWGLAFKPKTDDVREAPAIDVAKALVAAGATVSAFDPAAAGTAKALLGDSIRYAPGMYEAVEGADVLVLVTEWNEFRHPDFDRIKKLMRSPVVFDGRNVWDPVRMVSHGFEYHAVGRPSAR